MRLDKYATGSLERVLLGDGIRSFTIHTLSGSFSIEEQADGSLHIHESTHRRLAIKPRQTNALILEAVEE